MIDLDKLMGPSQETEFKVEPRIIPNNSYVERTVFYEQTIAREIVLESLNDEESRGEIGDSRHSLNPY